ncbi:MAG: hypothetical protein AAFZ65_10890 [Planctomycetota bacterium]
MTRAAYTLESDANGVLAASYYADWRARIEAGSFRGELINRTRPAAERAWREWFEYGGDRWTQRETVALGDGSEVVTHSAAHGQLTLSRDEQGGATQMQTLKRNPDLHDRRPGTLSVIEEFAERLAAVVRLAQAEGDWTGGSEVRVDLTLYAALSEYWRGLLPGDVRFVPAEATVRFHRSADGALVSVDYSARDSGRLLHADRLELDLLGQPTWVQLQFYGLDSTEPVIDYALALEPYPLSAAWDVEPFECVDRGAPLYDLRGGAVREVETVAGDIQNRAASTIVGPQVARGLCAAADPTDDVALDWTVPIQLEDQQVVSRSFAADDFKQGELRLVLDAGARVPATLLGTEVSCSCFELHGQLDATTGQRVLIVRLAKGRQPSERVAVNLAWAHPDAPDATRFTQVLFLRDDRAPAAESRALDLPVVYGGGALSRSIPLASLQTNAPDLRSGASVRAVSSGDLGVEVVGWEDGAEGLAQLELRIRPTDPAEVGALASRVELLDAAGRTLTDFVLLGTWLPEGWELGPEQSVRFLPDPAYGILTGPRLDLEAGRLVGLDDTSWSVDDQGRLVLAPAVPIGEFHWTDGSRRVAFRVF